MAHLNTDCIFSLNQSYYQLSTANGDSGRVTDNSIVHFVLAIIDDNVNRRWVEAREELERRGIDIEGDTSKRITDVVHAAAGESARVRLIPYVFDRLTRSRTD